MMWIQVLLILVAVGLVLWLARQKGTAVSAMKKTGLVLLALLMVVTVLFPELTTLVAHALGIGRGADLLLYVVTASFVVYAVTQYLKSQSQRLVMYTLARRIAIRAAADEFKVTRHDHTQRLPPTGDDSQPPTEEDARSSTAT